ncbi:MAG: cbb3-type cytochrome c oxidase subunit I [Bacteroidia bacterium]|nr:cbb3-type cytochrome c oxidase subunit I [Bacteroidia bacterium]
MKNKLEILFITLAVLSLLGGLFFGTIASIQFFSPETLSFIPFYKTRPLHVSLVVSWIFLASMGGIYFYLPDIVNKPLFSKKIAFLHFYLFLITGIIILICYFLGKFGGREYWEFPPILSIPVVLTWLLFGWNFFKSIFQKSFDWPVYVWMWTTGILFFLFTFSESYIWLLPQIKENAIKELTFQWKSYGALVGSWNMLVYGTAIYLMEKIKGDATISRSRIAFLSFFLGFINLLFGWAHHIYNVPTAHWIRILSYAISMTELLLLAKIILTWRSTLKDHQQRFYLLSYRFLVAADFWIFLNLVLAILISIPAVNIYTHGTHITVAHAMGSTIGINTMILLASCFYAIDKIVAVEYTHFQKKIITIGFVLFNIFLLLFWLTLIAAGAIKGISLVRDNIGFYEIMNKIEPYMILFSVTGMLMFVALFMILIFPLRNSIKFIFSR